MSQVFDKETVSQQERSDIFVIVPAYNEGPMLGDVLSELAKTGHQVVVVDDGSIDETHAIAKRHTSHVLKHLVNRGQGAALQTGIDYALAHGCSMVATFDADGQHRIEDMERMIGRIRDGECDVVLGSRFLDRETRESIPAGRRLLLRCATATQRILTGAKLTDAHNGLRVLSSKAASRIELTNDRMAHASEIIDQIFATDLVVKEHPVHIEYTEYSMGKGQSWIDGFRVLFHYIISRVFG